MRVNPLIVLGPGRSYTTVLTAMLGQHPEMYSFPETNLLMTRTIAEWLMRFGHNFMSQGLLRLIAQLIVGVQTEASVRFARVWLKRRWDLMSAGVFCELAECVSPRMPVDKSPAIVTDIRFMKLAHGSFPAARFLHVTRHPVSHGRSLMKVLDECLTTLRLISPFAAEMLVRSPNAPFSDMTDHRAGIPIVDPQIRWHQQHSNILAFLADVPPSHQMRISGEDLLANPDLMLRKITDWLGLRSGPKVIDGMKHPERWPFASVGPRNARFGNDPNFCKQPGLRAGRSKLESLDDALPWRADRVGIKPEVRRLAERFGYD